MLYFAIKTYKEIYGTLKLPVVLHGCETYPFTAHYFAILSHIILSRRITLQSSPTLSFHGTLLYNPVSH